MSTNKPLKSELTLHWVILGAMLLMLVSYNIICHTIGTEIRIKLPEEQLIFIRSILYVVTIILFPLTNLLRHILLRLNQTMPGHSPAKNRYLITTMVTLACIEIVGLFGFVMFMLGDVYNSLYIFTTLAVLGLFLHRPREQELRQITEALEINSNNN